jgi:O-acetyl-ADP-ribose deacetylase (regulator of RNase III)
MVRVKVGDITTMGDVEVIVNAANGKGPMGKGVAGAMSTAGKKFPRSEVSSLQVPLNGPY